MLRSLLSPLMRLGLLSGILLASSCDVSDPISWPVVKQKIRSGFPEVESISVDSLAARLESDDPPVLLDVREEAEYRVSHLAGAVRVDPDAGEAALPAGVGKDTPIVTYCSVGYRSAAFAERLKVRGYTAVQNLEGSIFEWANRGYPVVRDGREVREVHPYDRRWGVLLDEELHAYPAD